MPFLEANGIRQYHEGDGKGDALVLIHGHTLSLRMWDEVVPALARHYLVIRYDIRGHGRSEAPATGYYWQTYAADLVSLLERLGARSVCLVGFSLGGGVAIETALSFPKLIRGLVLIDSVLNGFKYSDEFTQLGRQFGEAIRQRGISDALDQVWLPGALFAHLQAKPALLRRLRDITVHYSGADFFATDRPRPPAQRHIDRLGEIEAPSLVMVGDEDMPDFRQIARVLRGGIAGSEFVELPNAGHMSMWERPDEFLSAVLPFLRSVFGGLV